jgi:hypothetical protein
MAPGQTPAAEAPPRAEHVPEQVLAQAWESPGCSSASRDPHFGIGREPGQQSVINQNKMPCCSLQLFPGNGVLRVAELKCLCMLAHLLRIPTAGSGKETAE